MTVIATGLGGVRKSASIQPPTKSASIERKIEQPTQASLRAESIAPVSRPNLSQAIKEAASAYETQKEAAEPAVEVKVAKEEKKTDYEIPSRAKSIAEKLGFMNFDEDEFDSPSYLRREHKEESNKDLY